MAFVVKQDTIVRIVAFGFMLAVLYKMFFWMLALITNGYAAIVGVFVLAIITFFGGICFLSISACWLVIFNESADGHYIIEEWPGMQFNDWMFDGVSVLTAAIVSVIPGWAFYRYGSFFN